jgi:hypothetical protein
MYACTQKECGFERNNEINHYLKRLFFFLPVPAEFERYLRYRRRGREVKGTETTMEWTNERDGKNSEETWEAE